VKIIQRLFTRLVTISIAILLQILFFLFIIVYIGRMFPFFYICFVGFSVLIVIWIGMKNDNPAYKLTWVTLILMAPLVGGVVYLLWGNKRLPRKTRRALEHFTATSLEYKVQDRTALESLEKADKDLAVTARYLDDIAGFPLWMGTEAEYFSTGEKMFTRLKEELAKAKSYIFMEYFIVEEGHMWDPILALLRKKIASGVEVYFMYDDIGCINTLPKNYDRKLASEGFRVQVVNPFRPRLNPAMNYRDHRKITVIDGKVAFCGGLNLADEYINERERFGHWKDTAVMIEGQAVWNLTQAFIRMWNFTCSNQKDYLDEGAYRHTIGDARNDGYVQPFSDTPLDFENVSENFFLNVINHATDYIYITTPYLVIDHEMQTALCLAAKNGVDVHLITPGIPDKKTIFKLTRSYYLPLLEAGVKISEYTPGFIHAKNLVVDDNVALVGTINMDYRSFYFHYECGVAFYRCGVIRAVKEDFHHTLRHSREITYAAAKKVPLYERVIRSILRLFAPLL
jgi:cardiolipin synthase